MCFCFKSLCKSSNSVSYSCLTLIQAWCPVTLCAVVFKKGLKHKPNYFYTSWWIKWKLFSLTPLGGTSCCVSACNRCGSVKVIMLLCPHMGCFRLRSRRGALVHAGPLLHLSFSNEASSLTDAPKSLLYSCWGLSCRKWIQTVTL